MIESPRAMPADPSPSVPAARPIITSHAAMRGLAALMVVLYHLQFGDSPRLAFETATRFFERCYLLVDFFFILSGFVISYVYGSALFAHRGRIDARRFYAGRFARIYPLHLFCLVYIVVAITLLTTLRGVARGAPVAPDLHLASLVPEALLIQSWIPSAPYWNVPSWSISAEAFAYALFPWIVIASGRWPRITIALFVAIPASFYSYVATTGGSLDIITGLAPLRCLSGFLLGMLAYLARARSQALSGPVKSAIQLVAVAGIVLDMAIAFNDVVTVPLFLALVWSSWDDRGIVPAILSGRVLQRLGEISYSIYLNHVCIIMILGQYWLKAYRWGIVDPRALRVVEIVSYIAVIVAVSECTYRFVEVPSRRRLGRMLKAGARATAPRSGEGADA